MKRMIVNKYGGPENLILEECSPPIIDELSVKIYNAFNEEKIEIPFPQRTVHLKKTDI